MGYLNIVTALWIILRSAIAIPIDARHVIRQRNKDYHLTTPKVFIINMVSWIKSELGSHEI